MCPLILSLISFNYEICEFFTQSILFVLLLATCKMFWNKLIIYIHTHTYTYIHLHTYMQYTHCLNRTCRPSHPHNDFMATVEFGHTHVWLHVPGMKESKECSSYYLSNQDKKYGRRMWAQETQSGQIPANQKEHNIHRVFNMHKAKSIIYIVTSWRQSNAPILITTMALRWHADYGQPVAEFIVSVRTNRLLNKH